MESMLETAVKFAKTQKHEMTIEQLREALENSSNGGVFGGNALSDFFRWNPFSKAPIDRAYERYCLVTFQGWTEDDVTQKHADEDLGESLLERLREHCGPQGFHPLCCSPRRDKEDGLGFWVNTGRQTQIDGWKTQEELEAFLAKKEQIKDRARF